MNFYEKAYQKIMEIPTNGTEQAPSMSDPTSQPTFLKICTNLAVCLEKQGQRDKALHILKMVQKKKPFEEERKLNNNLGVMHQRLG